MSIPSEKVYRVFPSVIAPIVLGLTAAYFEVTYDYWVLCAIPFIVLGSICAAPNLNLADGFLVIVFVLLGIVVSIWRSRLGNAMVFGSMAGSIGGAIEKRIRMRPE
jgi:hypothetical protein